MQLLCSFEECGGGRECFSAVGWTFDVEPLADVEVQLIGEIFERCCDGAESLLAEWRGISEIQFAANGRDIIFDFLQFGNDCLNSGLAEDGQEATSFLFHVGIAFFDTIVGFIAFEEVAEVLHGSVEV